MNTIEMDEFGMTQVGPKGERTPIPPSSMEINGIAYFKYDQESGHLELSASTESIRNMIDSLGGLPVDALKLPGPLGEVLYIGHVTKITSLEDPSGRFVMTVKEKPGSKKSQVQTPRKQKSLFSRLMNQLGL